MSNIVHKFDILSISAKNDYTVENCLAEINKQRRDHPCDVDNAVNTYLTKLIDNCTEPDIVAVLVLYMKCQNFKIYNYTIEKLKMYTEKYPNNKVSAHLAGKFC